MPEDVSRHAALKLYFLKARDQCGCRKLLCTQITRKFYGNGYSALTIPDDIIIRKRAILGRSMLMKSRCSVRGFEDLRSWKDVGRGLVRIVVIFFYQK